MHDLDFDHEHDNLSDSERQQIADWLWKQETVDLLTVGIDIGSSTSHLLFANVVLRRETDDLSSRFVVVDRRVVWRSPILLTPFLPDGTIDAHELRHFFQHCYHDAGYKRSHIDTGAVILTGEAIKRKNARAIDEIFANESGRFVCATAGHKLECMLAAHGSGATALSKKRDACGLHVDIGGGTTKLALIDKGEIISVAAFAVGGRLLAQDSQGTWSRVDDSARIVAEELGLGTDPATIASAENRRAVAKRLAAAAVDEILGEPLDALGERLLLTEPLERPVQPTYITFSGGVSEYIFDYEQNDHGDIARDLASEIVAQLKPLIEIPIVDAGQRIRATVIGASQFTVQVSGKTLYMNGAEALPKHNIPVVHLGKALSEDIDPEEIAAAFRESAGRQDHDVSAVTALAFSWTGTPDYQRLLAMAKAIKMVAAPEGERKELLVLMIDGDVGQTIGRILDRELGIQSHLISIDGVRLKDLDFVDLGEFMNPPGVIPVVIKSLLFS
ncbi:ethanolamine ammonia-lyase reactivating factor EutA [Sinorhizobium terangae]|uniref:ethanolamine ammonia-lyase reactivating factor EutA n=1 Tax=Sinorhizobium terangae TaxID=110322 RepID=UPI0024B0F404|nr:ethanolamine ammonia-lyase reactivating factor EutA [Sinorhizobium terangae]WFU51443.1 ethanolamine ammonia-lyase reactivating factor EutA [Sinorhizobium terangae]